MNRKTDLKTKQITHLIISIAVFILFAFPSALFGKGLSTGKSEGMFFRVEQVAKLPGIPWGMVFINQNEIIFTLKKGKIGLLDVRKNKTTMLSGDLPRVKFSGQGGLLDVAVPRGFKSGGWIYFTYSRDIDGQAATTLAKARLNKYNLNEWQDILVTQSVSNSGNHFGSRITFDGKGHLFFTVGDRGYRPNGQDLSSHAGTILRVTLEGRIPESNPFNSSSSVLGEIFSYGHRNPQGIAYDALNKRLWAIEHGPRGGDELNLILPGKNYGWPTISYGKEYWGPVQVGEGTHKKGMEQPVKYYTPSIAPGSLILYSGSAFPEWRGNLFAGALKLEHLNRIVLDDKGKFLKEERLLENLEARIRALAQSPEGWIYFSTDDGDILRLRPNE